LQGAIADPEIGRQLQNAERECTYEIVAGRWLVLSASKRHGRARLDGEKKLIIFTYLAIQRALPCLLDAERTNQRPATISYVPLSLSIL